MRRRAPFWLVAIKVVEYSIVSESSILIASFFSASRNGILFILNFLYFRFKRLDQTIFCFLSLFYKEGNFKSDWRITILLKFASKIKLDFEWFIQKSIKIPYQVRLGTDWLILKLLKVPWHLKLDSDWLV